MGKDFTLLILDIKIDENLNWKRKKISDTAIKLNRTNAVLSNLRYFIDRKTLKSVYHAIFESHLCYSSLVWAQNLNSIKRLFVLLKKSLRITYFWSCNAHTSPLFRESNILKFPDKIVPENCLFINILTNFYPESLKIGLLFHLIFIPTVLAGLI